MAAQRFRPGDRVEWDFHDTTVRGTVEEEFTADTHAAGRVVRASPQRPQYRVRSAKTGKESVHTARVLRRLD